MDNAGTMLTLSGPIGGVGGLTKNGPGGLTLSNSANNLAGGVTVNAGTLDLGGLSYPAGAVSLSNGTIQDGGLSGSSYAVQSGLISASLAGGGVTLTKSTSGLVTLTANNTYTGSTTISGGTLAIGDGTTDGSIAASSNIVNNGALLYNLLGGAVLFRHYQRQRRPDQIRQRRDDTHRRQQLRGRHERHRRHAANFFRRQPGAAGAAITLANGATLNVNSGITTTRPITLAGGGGTIDNLQPGSGVWLYGPISGGSLTILNGNVILAPTSANSMSSLTLMGSTTAILPNSVGVTYIQNQNSIGTANISVQSGAVFDVYAGSLSPTNVMTFASGSAVDCRSGTLTLNTANATFPSSGTLNCNASDTGAANGAVTINGAYPVLTGGMTFNVPSGTLTLNGALTDTGNGSLTKTGAGTLLLAGSNTYAGMTTVANGGGTLILADTAGTALAGNVQIGNGGPGTAILQMGAPNQFAPTAVVANAGSPNNWTYFKLMGNNQTVAGVSDTTGAGVIENADTESGYGPATLTIDNTANYSFNGYIRDHVSGTSSPLSLVVGGSGTLTLSGGNLTYSGATAINGGTVTIAGNGALPNTTSITIGPTATLDLSGTNNNQLPTPSSGTLAVSGVLAVTNSLTSTLYAGTIVLSGGTLTSSAGNGTYGSYWMNNSGTITASGTGNTISAVNFGINAGQTLTLNTPLAGDTLTASSQFFGYNNSATAALAKSGSGMLILTGSSTLAGPTTINGGTLQLANPNALPDSTVSVNAANGLVFALGTTAITIGGLAGSGSFPLADVGGNPVTLSTGGNGASTTYSGSMSGGGGLIKTGTGGLALFGGNSYAGPTTVSAGTLQLANLNALPNSTVTVNAANGLAFAPGTTATTIGGLAGNGGFALASAGGSPVILSLGGNGGATTYSGIMSGGGGLVMTGTGTFALTANNTYTGGTTVNGGTLALGAGANNGAGIIQGPLTINSGAVVANAMGNWNFGWVSGECVSSIAINGGVMNLNSTNAGMSASSVLLTGGTLSGSLFQWYNGITSTPTLATGAASTTSVVSTPLQFRLGTTGYLTLNVAAGNPPGGTDLLVSGPITNNAGGGLVKTGSGTVVLTGGNTYSGPTSINAGVMTIAGSGTLASTPSITIGPGATLNLSGNNYNEIQSAASGGTLTVEGLLAVTTNTAHTLYAGTITLSGGTMTSSQSVPTYGAFYCGSGGPNRTITASGAGNTISAVNFGIAGGNTLTLNTPLPTDSLTSSTTFFDAANLAGGALTKTGSGTLFLTGESTYTGATSVNGGVANAGCAQSGTTSGPLGASGTINFGGGTLQYSAANQYDYSPRFSTAGNQPWSIDTNGRNVTFASSLQGGGSSLTLNDSNASPGMLTLSGSNSYSGGTMIESGTLQVANSAALGIGGLTANGGTLDLAGYSVTVASFSGAAGTITNSSSSLAILTVNQPGSASQAGSTTFSGAINNGAGQVALAKSATGTLVLAGTNNYSGGTTLSNGVLVVNNADSLGVSTGALAINSATLEVAAGFAESRNIALTNADATIQVDANQTYTNTGAISAAGGLDLTGSGTLVLAGSANFGGHAHANAGTLVVNGSLAANTINVNNAAQLSGTGTIATTGDSLYYNSTTPSTFAGSIVGGQGVEVQSGTLVLAGSNSFAGGVSVDNNATAVLRIGAQQRHPLRPGGGRRYGLGLRHARPGRLHHQRQRPVGQRHRR